LPLRERTAYAAVGIIAAACSVVSVSAAKARDQPSNVQTLRLVPLICSALRTLKDESYVHTNCPLVRSSCPGGRSNWGPKSVSVTVPSALYTSITGPEPLKSMYFRLVSLMILYLKVPAYRWVPSLKVVR
jgi:hypothetical protein